MVLGTGTNIDALALRMAAQRLLRAMTRRASEIDIPPIVPLYTSLAAAVSGLHVMASK